MPTAAHGVWPDAASYRHLEAARPADLAWEWLRRNPGYRRIGFDRTWETPGTVPIVERAPAECTARWGCLNLPHPDLSWQDAPILWSAHVDPSVLKVMALRSSGRRGGLFDLRRCRAAATLVRGQGCEHVLLRDGDCCVRLDVASGTLLAGPVSVFVDLASVGEIEPAIGALRRFHHLCRTGGLPTPRGSARQGPRRQVMALRVFDALAQGASIRDVGVMLFGVERVRDEWAGEALKSQCRRLIALARTMAGGGYLSLLR